ncbi:hypothetical protein KCU88_g7, partial [Aureobasidium melanogenum]
MSVAAIGCMIEDPRRLDDDSFGLRHGGMEVCEEREELPRTTVVGIGVFGCSFIIVGILIDIAENFYIVIMVFWLVNQSSKRWEGLDAFHVQVRLQSSVQQVQVQLLLRGMDQARIQQGLVQHSVESVIRGSLGECAILNSVSIWSLNVVPPAPT